MVCSNCGKAIPVAGMVCPYCHADKSKDRRDELRKVGGAMIGDLVAAPIGYMLGGIIGIVIGAGIGSFAGAIYGLLSAAKAEAT